MAASAKHYIKIYYWLIGLLVVSVVVATTLNVVAVIALVVVVVVVVAAVVADSGSLVVDICCLSKATMWSRPSSLFSFVVSGRTLSWKMEA